MSMLKFTSFGGEVPRLTKRDLPDNNGQICENLLPDAPEFRPLPTDIQGPAIGNMAVNAVCKTLYRYPTNSTDSIGSPLMLSLVRSPIVGDELDRVYSSVMFGETEAAPAVLSYSGGTSTVRPLGVKYPTVALTLAQATVDDAFLTPSEITDYKESLMQRIKAITSTALEKYLWNPAFNLGSLSAFREDPYNTGKGIYQRMYVLTNPGSATPVWNTLNGTPVANHEWTTQIASAPYKDESPNRVYYANFQAKVWVWRVKADVSAQTTQLQALVIPGTTDRVLTDGEITALWAALRLQLTDDPLSTASTDLQTLLNRYQSEYLRMVNYLDQGFALADVTPQAGFQLVANASGLLQQSVDGITSFYDKLATTDFDAALLGYFKEVRFTGKLPDGETVVADPRFYTYSLVNDRGEESALFAPASGSDYPFIECNQATTATVTLPAGAISALSPTDYISKWRVYRTAYSGTDTKFQFVAEVPIGVTTYTDLRLTEGLNEVAENATWFPPPTSGSKYMKHMVSMPGGFMAGFLGDTVYFSVPYHPYAWPPEYSIPCESDVLALGVFGATLVAFTKRGPIFMSGSAPESISPVTIESNEVCQSPRSVVPIAGGVLFASQNGLCVASQQGVKCLTEQLWTKKEWESLQPENFICEEHNGNVFMSHTGGLVVGCLHLPSMKLVRMDMSLTAFYSDFYTGELFAALPPVTGSAPTFVKITDGTGVRTARWRSKRIVLEKETSFAWLRVEGEQSVEKPLNVNIYCYQIDGTGAEVTTKLLTATGDATYSAVVTNTAPLRVSAGRYKDFEVEINGQCRVTSVQLFSSTAELQQVN